MTGLTEQELATALKRSVPEPASGADRAGLARGRAHRIRTRRRAAVAAGAVAVALAVVLPTTLLNPGRGSNGGPAASAPSGGRSTGCSPDGCDPAAVAAAIRTPLWLPTVSPGEGCPVSPRRTFRGGAGFSGAFSALGKGPLYLAGPVLRSGAVQLGQGGPHWQETKVIWVFGRDYAGPVLLRGGRIDEPGPLRFQHYLGAADYPASAPASARHRSVLYVRGGLHARAADVLDSYPDEVSVAGPGCYAVQVDGEGFSEHLVFRVVGP